MKLIYKIRVNKSNSCEVQPGEGQSSRADATTGQAVTDVMYTTALSLEQKHLQTAVSRFQNERADRIVTLSEPSQCGCYGNQTNVRPDELEIFNSVKRFLERDAKARQLS